MVLPRSEIPANRGKYEDTPIDGFIHRTLWMTQREEI